jgi:hypothetical protein
MIASALIFGFSLVLLAYWFRYSCLLLIRSHGGHAASTPQTSRFSLRQIQDGLKLGQDLDPLHAALRRDYQILMYLLEHASGLGSESFEDRLLALDYRLMQLWYRLTRTIFPRGARGALSEMASVVEILVYRLGEHAEAA